MPQPIPYLIFNGNCEEATRFYAEALGAKLSSFLRFSEMPCPSDSSPMSPEVGRRVAHVRLTFADNGMLFAGDSHPSMGYDGIKGVTLTLSYDTVEQAHKAYKALSEGGEVMMPMGEVFWAKVGGMFTDKFGVRWTINGELKPVV